LNTSRRKLNHQGSSYGTDGGNDQLIPPNQSAEAIKISRRLATTVELFQWLWMCTLLMTKLREVPRARKCPLFPSPEDKILN
jgi:hypothetical protein